MVVKCIGLAGIVIIDKTIFLRIAYNVRGIYAAKQKIMKKQFLLFAGDDYYPDGGAYDFKGSFDTQEEAVKAHDPNEHEYDGGWANVFDLKKEKIVKKFSRGTWYDGEAEIY